MNYNTKRKIKKFFKEKWKVLVGSGAFLLVGGVVMLIGFSVTGWSIIKWLQSPFAITTLIFVLAGIFVFVIILLLFKNQNLMK